MKTAIFFLLIILQSALAAGQNSKIDSLNKRISKATTDTGRINLEIKKTNVLSDMNYDSSLSFGLKVLEEIKKKNYYEGEVKIRMSLASTYAFKGNYKATEEQLEYLKHFIRPSKDSSDYGTLYGRYGLMYDFETRYDTAIAFYKKAIGIFERIRDTDNILPNYINISNAYQEQSDFPMALLYQQRTLKIAELIKDEEDQAYAYVNMAITYGDLGDTTRSINAYSKAAVLGKKNQLTSVELYAYSNLSSLYLDQKKWYDSYKLGVEAALLGGQIGDQGIQASSLSRAAVAFAHFNKIDSAIKLADRAIAIADSSKQPITISQAFGNKASILLLQQKWEEAIPYYEKSFLSVDSGDIYNPFYGMMYQELSECYEKTGKYDKALDAFKTAARINDSTASKHSVQKTTELTLNYDFEKKQQLLQAEQRSKDAVQKTKQVSLIIALALMLGLVIVAFIGFRNKQKANVLLSSQKQEIEQTLAKLKSTQTQLLHAEKMASLGELTAGIAHEIQNPLNFVNNFSEVSAELVDEMNDAIEKGDLNEVKLIAADIKENLKKINHHGARAGAIVKNMLQHSGSSGKKEAVNINALADEYLRLSYHGFRTKDKSFNAELKTDFDQSINKINVVPQDIGRVILNIINNAFYAVNEKRKMANSNYQPVISVSTKYADDKTQISISDNGNGIPEKTIAKIFQPFFTTKPTGEGTGLGLSLSYDIITKGHNGEIKVETKAGEGTTFIILILSV